MAEPVAVAVGAISAPSAISVWALIPREPFGLPLAAWIGGVVYLFMVLLMLGSMLLVAAAALLHGRRHREAACRPGLHRRPGAGHHGAPGAGDAAPAVPGRRARHRQDRDRQGAGRRPEPPAGAAAMLRRHGPVRRRLRVGPRPPVDGDPPGRGRRPDRPRRTVPRHLHPRIPAGPPAAVGDRPGPAARGAADRRAGPRRRAVRGVPAGTAGRLPDHRAGVRHRAGEDACRWWC